MTLREVLLQVAEAFQSVEPGHNGPRSVPETPVRNTAHWINLLTWAYQQTGQVHFAEQGTQLADLLLSPEARPQGYAYKNFVSDSANAGNGLVGQAWVMEGLINAGKTFGCEKCLEVAQELFHQHQFDEEQGLWRILNVDGSIGSVHATLNQQIWFTAVGTLLHDAQAIQKAQRFLDTLENHIHLLTNGLWGMRIRSDAEKKVPLFRQLRTLLKKQKGRFFKQDRQWRNFSYRVTSIGYHSFAMYGTAILKTALPDHPFWHSEALRAGLQWIQSSLHQQALRNNPFAMGYNPAGFEVPYILSVFGVEGWERESQWWLSEQVQRHYNPTTCRFDRNTTDAAVLTARAYEAIRLPEDLLELTVLSEAPKST